MRRATLNKLYDKTLALTKTGMSMAAACKQTGFKYGTFVQRTARKKTTRTTRTSNTTKSADQAYIFIVTKNYTTKIHTTTDKALELVRGYNG